MKHMAKQSSGKKPQNRPAGKVSTAPVSAAQRREQRQTTMQRSQQQQRNRRKVQRKANTGMWITLGVVVVAIAVVIGVFIYLGTRSSPSSSANGNSYPSTPADPAIVKQITSISPATLAAVGAGPSGKVTRPTKLNFTTLLTGSDGKPEIFYDGAEYCPNCAAERWSMMVALSRFGTFSKLSQISSSATDVDPNTATFSFYHSSYTSQYIDFVPLEQESYQGVTLQTPNAEQQQILKTYNPSGGYPFIDFANKYMVIGASYDPATLSNLGWQSIAGSLSNPNNPVAQAVLGTANYLTAAICEATNQQPASVCAAAPIPQVEAAMNSPTGSNSSSQRLALTSPAAVVRERSG